MVKMLWNHLSTGLNAHWVLSPDRNSATMAASSIWNDQVLRIILDSIKSQILAPINDDIYTKLAWLYDRLAGHYSGPAPRRRRCRSGSSGQLRCRRPHYLSLQIAGGLSWELS